MLTWLLGLVALYMQYVLSLSILNQSALFLFYFKEVIIKNQFFVFFKIFVFKKLNYYF